MLRTHKARLFLLSGGVLLLVILLGSQGLGQHGLATASAETVTIDPEKSLLIRDLAVVEDPLRTYNPCTGVGTPMGKWTFGYLMSEMANEPVTGIDPADFVTHWLSFWQNNTVVNTEGIRQRTPVNDLIIDPWLAASGGSELDLGLAPFRLMAIVNRVDLRSDPIQGESTAGEGRFIFAAVDLQNNCAPLPFTLSFEYLVERDSCGGIQAWAQQWRDLAQFDLGSTEYNSALETITDQFVVAGAIQGRNPNQNGLKALFTNEIAMGRPWQMRSFQLVPSGRSAGFLEASTIAHTPAKSINGTTKVTDFINENEAAILQLDYTVPLQYQGAPFLGGKAEMSAGTIWDGPRGDSGINSPEARHIFSLNTCSGCHSGETGTAFTHIKPTGFGQVAQLSGFMTGISVVDPEDGQTVRQFGEIPGRIAGMEMLMNNSCDG